MRILKVFLALVLGVVVLAVGLVLLLPGEKLAAIAARQIEAQIGRAVTFEGGVSLSFYPVLGARTGPVRIANADWSESGPMLTAESLLVGMDAAGLWGGALTIRQIEAVRPVVILERAADGRTNWDISGSDTAAAGGGGSGGAGFDGIAVDQVSIRDAEIRYIDAGDVVYARSGLDLTLGWPGAGKPLEGTVTLRAGGEALDVALALADPAAVLQSGVSDLSLKISGAGVSGFFAGQVSALPELGGKLTAEGSDLDRLTRVLGLGAFGLPGGFRIDGALGYGAEGRVTLRDADVTLAGTRMGVTGDLYLEDRLRVVAKVAAGVLDLSAFSGGTAGGGAGAGASGWSTTPIDASALGLVDGEIALAAEGVRYGDITLGATRGSVVIQKSRAVATIREASAFGGAITGEFVVNNRSGLSVAGRLNVSQVELQDVLGATTGVTRLTGKANFGVNVLGSGGSVDAIMKSLKGEASVDAGRGTIEGLDLDKLFRGAVEGGTTVFDSLKATFVIRDGVASNNDLRLDLPHVLAKGKGTIGIGKREIDYLLTPELRTEAEDGLAVPVRIRGPWASPGIAPDLEALAARRMELEKARLTEEAEKKISEQLGIEAKEGQTPEEALKEKLENELRKKLGLPPLSEE